MVKLLPLELIVKQEKVKSHHSLLSARINKQTRQRYGLCVLNYIVTSNHIHLLVKDTGVNVIPQSLQLIAGRTAQQYNQRNKRKGA